MTHEQISAKALAFEQGDEARRRDAPISSNPHPENSPEFFAWCNGYHNGEGSAAAELLAEHRRIMAELAAVPSSAFDDLPI